ncbi:taste receptor type 1 member 2-like [Acanthochromis polyacanthus]|uniref:taste receptor type 1 member 2-like n=1 Tax=Acanthochromis polyacanthus TaxID=80966 RepID=UPI002234DB09|nr:taste receptor type 1 member 2-like [Acanthochromis polyacanthus]
MHLTLSFVHLLCKTEDPYSCISCKLTEWSAEGSTSCNQRLVEFIPFTDSGAILIMLGAGALVGLTLALSVLFAVNYNTPVVRSAGGPMCFLILGCLSLCSISVFFYFGQPSVPSCVLRFLPFFLFYTVCLACFVVRSFQIVCIFKIAAKFPKLHSWWMKYHGQWLVIVVAFTAQALLLIIGYSCAPPKPYNETVWYPEKIILSCDFNITGIFAPCPPFKQNQEFKLKLW